jgi:hypothetical protein
VFDGGAGLGSLRHFAALTRLETSLFALVGHNDAVWSERCPSLADHLPPRLRYLGFFDDLWSEPTFSKIQDLPTMAVFKVFLSGELPAENWPLNLVSKDLKWITTKEPAWKISTPDLTEFAINFEETDSSSHPFWHSRELKVDLLNMCEAQGIQCFIWPDN